MSRLVTAADAAGALAGNSPGAGWRIGPDEAAAGQLIPLQDVSQPAAQGGHGCGIGKAGDPMYTLQASTVHGIAHTLRGEGFDASEDGTGRGTPLVPVPFDTTQITSAGNYSNPKAGDPCHPLAAGAHAPAIAFNWQGGGTQTKLGYDPEAGVAGSLHVGQTPAIAFSGKDYGADATADLAPTLRAMGHAGNHANGGGQMAVQVAAAVRRLMPVECERLQGFPDGYTSIPYRGKPASECPDGPRYKALGNSWAVNCARWIGWRISVVEQITGRRAA